MKLNKNKLVKYTPGYLLSLVGILLLAGFYTLLYSDNGLVITSVSASEPDVTHASFESYNSNDTPTFAINMPSELSPGDQEEGEGSLQLSGGKITAVVYDNHDKKVDIATHIVRSENESGEYVVTVPPSQKSTPGKYRLEVSVSRSGLTTEKASQEFIWGVLALNIAKSSYEIGESVEIGSAVLDDAGVTICDADIEVEITSPGGDRAKLSTDQKTVTTSDSCVDKNFTLKPDYLSVYTPKEVGEYEVVLTAETKNGKRQSATGFVVSDTAKTVTDRRGATRIFPANTYPNSVAVSIGNPLKDGIITETVPSSFNVTDPTITITSSEGTNMPVEDVSFTKQTDGKNDTLSWGNVHAAAGSTVRVAYKYKAPPVSPAFYVTGPLTVKDSNTSFTEPRQWQIAGDSIGDVILLWDTANGSIPSGWTCVSCTPGDPFYQRFARASSTYGGTGGGPETVDHAMSVTSVSNPSALVSLTLSAVGSINVGSTTHKHTFPGMTSGATDIKPPYKQLQFIKKSNPISLPANIIGMFDVSSTSLPASWSHDTSLTSKYLRGENTSSTGGSATHNHSFGTTTSGSPSATTAVGTVGAGANNASSATHTHGVAAGNLTADTNNPLFVDIVFGTLTGGDNAIPDGLLAMFDSTSVPVGWSVVSNAAPYNGNLIKGSASFGGTGGRTTHNHTGAITQTSGVGAGVAAGAVATTPVATLTHTHNVAYSIAPSTTMPQYRDVIVGKFKAVDVSGTVYQDDGVTPLASAPLKITVAGEGQRSTTSAADGSYSVKIPDPGAGGTITGWIDSNGGDSGAFVSRSNGGTITGLDMYRNRLLLRHEGAGPITNTDIGVCDKLTGTACTDADLHFNETGGNLTVDSDWGVYIWAGKSYTTGGSLTLSPGASAGAVGGDLTWGSGSSSLSVGANSVSVGGDWANSVGGNFVKSSGQSTTLTAGSAGFSVKSASVGFENLSFNGAGGSWSFLPDTAPVVVASNFTITNGTVTAPTNLSVAGNWTSSGSFLHNGGTITFNGSSTGKTITPNISPFNNITFNGSGAWSPATNDMVVQGNLTMASGTFDTTNGTANVTVNGNVQGANGVINMTSANTFTQRVTSNKNFGTTTSATNWTFNNLVFSNASASAATITTQTGGTGTVTINGAMNVSSASDSAATSLDAGNRTWKLSNSNSAKPFNLDLAGGNLIAAASTFEYIGNNASGEVTIENATYNDLTLGGVLAENYQPEGATNVAGNLVINTNATIIGTQDVTVNKNVTGTGTISLTGGLFVQRINSASTFGTTSGNKNWTFNNLHIENSAGINLSTIVNSGGTGSIIANGEVTIGKTSDTNILMLDNETNDRIIDANADVTITAKGSLTASSTALFTVAGSYQNDGVFSAGTGKVTFDSSSGGKTLTGSMTGVNQFYNLDFNGSGNWSFGANNATAGNNFSILNGTVTAPSTALTVSGSFSNAATFTHNSGLIVFDSSSTGKTINTGGSFFNQVNFNGSGGWTFAVNNAVVQGRLSLIAGTVGSSVDITANSDVDCGGAGTCGVFTIASGTFRHDVNTSRNFGTTTGSNTWSFNHLVLASSSSTPTISFSSGGTGDIITAGTLSTVNAGTSLLVAASNRSVRVGGNVTIGASTTLSAPNSSNSFTIAGSYANNGSFSHGSGTVIFNATSGGKTLSGNMTGPNTFNNLTFNGVGGAWLFSSNAQTATNSGDFTITNGTVTAPSGTLTLGGNYANSGTFTHNSGSVLFAATSSKTLSGSMIGVNSFNNLQFSGIGGSWAFSASAQTATNTGDITITNGTVTAPAGTLTIGGNLTNTASLSHGSGTILFSATTSGKTIALGGSPLNAVTFNGVGGGWTFVTTNAVIGSRLSVIRGTVSSNVDITATADVDCGGAGTCGNFAISSGTFTHDVSASRNFGTTVGSSNWVFNTLLFRSASGTPTVTINSGGTGTIATNANLTTSNTGSSLTVDAVARSFDVEGNSTIGSGTTFKSPGSGQSFTLAGSYANNGSFVHNTGTVTFDATSTGKTLAGSMTGSNAFNNLTFNGSGGAWSFSANAQTATNTGNVTISNGSVTAPSGTLTVGGNFTNTATFLHNTATLEFSATALGKTIAVGTAGLHKLVFGGGGGGWTFVTNQVDVANDIDLIAGTVSSSVDITARGTVACGGAGTCGIFSISNGTFTHLVATPKTFGTTAGASTWTFNNLTFSSSAGNPSVTLSGGGSGTIVANGNLSTTNAGSSFGLDASGRSVSVGGDVSIGSGTTYGASTTAQTFTVGGSWSNAGVFNHNSGTVTFNGTAASKTINSGGSNFNKITVSGSGSWSSRTNPLIIVDDLTLNNGTFGTSGDTSDITVKGNVGGSAGVLSPTASGRTFTHLVGSNKNFGPSSPGTNWNFNSLVFSSSPASTITTVSGTGTMTVNNVLTIGSSTTLGAGNRTWTLAGTTGLPFVITAGGVLSPQTSTFVYSGNNGSGNTNVLGGISYYNLTLNNASEIYDASATITTNNNLLVNAGVFGLGSQAANIDGNATINGTLTGTGNQTVKGNVNGTGTISLTGGTFAQTVNAVQSFGTTSGSSSWNFNDLTFTNISGTNTVSWNGGGTGQIAVNGQLGLTNAGAALTVTDAANRILDANGNVNIGSGATFVAPPSASFTVEGNWNATGQFTHNSGTVTFDSGVIGRTITTGGTGTNRDFYNLVFNNSLGGWSISSNLTANNNVTLVALNTALPNGLIVGSGVTIEVNGTYAITNTSSNGTDWASNSTLYLNPTTTNNYTIGSKIQAAEVYGNVHIGTNANIRLWQSSNVGSTTVDAGASNGSLYSQNHGNVQGRLNIYGNYAQQGVSNDYWSWATDFDGTNISGSPRQAVVRIETGAGRGVTIPSGRNLAILGGGSGAAQCSDIDRLDATISATCSGVSTGGPGSYQLVNDTGSTLTIDNSKVASAEYKAGNWQLLNTINRTPTFTSGTVNVDWYLALDVVNRDSTATAVTTGASDVTICETTSPSASGCGNSGSSAATIYKYSGGWGAPATSQSHGTDSFGKIPQPNTTGAMRIREYSNVAGSYSYYQYNLTIAPQQTYASYNYKRDHTKYLTSDKNTGSSESKAIGDAWYRDSISVQNNRPSTVNTLNQTSGTWYVGMAKAVVLLWDGASLPSGWSCVSCTGGDPFYQKFVRAAGSYGGTGGSDTASHTLGLLSQNVVGAGFTGGALTNNASALAHTHTWNSANVSSSDIKPPYRQLQFIRGPISGVWPAGIIAPFETLSVPANWSNYAAMDTNYLRGENTVTNGGNVSHTHAAPLITSGGGAEAGATTCVTGCTTVPVTAHTHTLAAQSLAAENNIPSFVQRPFYKLTTSSTAPADTLGIFDYASSPSGWSVVSNAAPFQNNLLKGGTSFSSGGVTTHSHSGTIARSSGTPGGATTSTTSVSGSLATTTHTHNVTHTVGSASILPAYIDAVIMKFAGGAANAAPASPTALIQKKVTSGSILATGGWTNESKMSFSATISDPDNDAVSLCVEAVPVASSFAGSANTVCSGSVTSGATASVELNASTSPALADASEYHWQAFTKDVAGAFSVSGQSYPESPTNSESARDFGIDTTAPTGGVIFDNTNSVSQPSVTDATDNGDGSLTTLSASWNGFNVAVSGLDKYQYSIGKTSGATGIKNWTDTGASGQNAFIRDSGLTLETNQTYYINVRVLDKAGNTSAVISSDGQYVTPTLSFDLDIGGVTDPGNTSPPYAVDFGVLSTGTVETAAQRIWLSVDSNNYNGTRVFISGQYSGLFSDGANYTLSSNSSDLASMGSGYGAQIQSISQAGGLLAKRSPYNGSGSEVGIIDPSVREVLFSNGPIVNGRSSIRLLAKITSLTPASNDYQDRVTMIATSSY